MSLFFYLLPNKIWTLLPTSKQTQEELEYEANLLILRLLRYSSFEMRQVILNCIFNQVTYPNRTTQFYLTFLLA